MDKNEQIIKDLKAEVYDVSKQLQHLSSVLSQIALIVKAETVDDVLSSITAKFSEQEEGTTE